MELPQPPEDSKGSFDYESGSDDSDDDECWLQNEDILAACEDRLKEMTERCWQCCQLYVTKFKLLNTVAAEEVGSVLGMSKKSKSVWRKD